MNNGSGTSSMAKKMRKRRSEETVEQAEKRRRSNAAREREKRQNASNEELAAIRQSTSKRQQAYRQRKRSNMTTLKDIAENACENESEIQEHFCGSLTAKCIDCAALYFETESFNSKLVTGDNGNQVRAKTFNKCCKNGQINLEKRQVYPEPFMSLMKRTTSLGENFMENIRSINSSFAFASMGANIDAPKGYGPYCFRIHGQIYHRTGTLHPQNGDERQYAQLYILDTAEANSERAKLSANANVNMTVFDLISDFMNKNNKLTEAYRMLHEVEKECLKDAEKEGMNVAEVTMAIVHDRNKDQRRYNSSRANQVAVVFSNKDGLPPLHRDIIIHLKSALNDGNKGMKRISILDSNLEATVYPVLFPFGEQGWKTDLMRNKTGSRVRISMMEYYSYRLSIRDEFNPLLNAGKLTQQYFVDAYVKTEGNRLSYIQNNHKEWRGDTLKGLQDFIATSAELQGKTAGTAVILPSSFQGGPRYMHQNYQDAMAIVTKFGKPDLFVTMTCNPKWKEITENLEQWQRAEHRADLIAKVFNLKLKSLLSDITNPHGGIFGKVVAHVHVIEFQKRGLPHAHILLILDKEDKLNTSDKIDKAVKAEIPDKEKNPKLFEIVTSHMVHGPCVKGSKSPCMNNEVCQKSFPKPFQDETLSNNDISDGYAKYRRRQGLQIFVRGKTVHNGWIVPYNPFLLLKYNCHINVEVCASVQSVKYLFKYVYKGHDCASVAINDSNVINQDEIRTHIDSRYVSAPEAAWRLFGNEMHNQSHSVERLAVHLPGEQYIIFNVTETKENENESTIERTANNAIRKHTTFTGWFVLNSNDANAHQYYYWRYLYFILGCKKREGGK